MYFLVSEVAETHVGADGPRCTGDPSKGLGLGFSLLGCPKYPNTQQVSCVFMVVDTGLPLRMYMVGYLFTHA